MHDWDGYSRRDAIGYEGDSVERNNFSSSFEWGAFLFYYIIILWAVFGQEVTVKRASQLPLVAEVRDMKVSLVYDIRPQITTGGSANYIALYDRYLCKEPECCYLF